MKRTWLLLVLAAACSKPKRLPECEAFQSVVTKLSKCSALPQSAKDSIAKTKQQLDAMFDRLDSAGGIDQAPADLKEQLRTACQSQTTAVTDVYQKLAPDCLK